MDNKQSQNISDALESIVIIVNSREKRWEQREISYEEVVKLAFGTYLDDESVVYTVTFSKGPGSNPEGTLVKGQSAKIKKGMIFNVTKTDKS